MCCVLPRNILYHIFDVLSDFNCLHRAGYFEELVFIWLDRFLALWNSEVPYSKPTKLRELGLVILVSISTFRIRGFCNEQLPVYFSIINQNAFELCDMFHRFLLHLFWFISNGSIIGQNYHLSCQQCTVMIQLFYLCRDNDWLINKSTIFCHNADIDA